MRKNFILGLHGTLCLVLGVLFIVSFITACTNDNPNSAFNIASTISGNFMLLRYHGGISAEYQNLLASLSIYNYKFMDHHADITKISLFASAPITKAQLNANLPDFFNAFYPDTTGHKRLNLIKEDVNGNHKINLTLYCEDNVYSCKNQALELGCEEVYIDRSVVLATCDIQATQKLQMNKITLGVNRPSLPDVLPD
jgi:hypothetical protein